MNPDLRAIEAALLGEPCDPSNLSPEAASVALPLVRRVVQERDALKAEMADLLKPAVDIDLRGALANVRALRALLGIPAAERTTGERADIEALRADMTEAMGMVLLEIVRLRRDLDAERGRVDERDRDVSALRATIESNAEIYQLALDQQNAELRAALEEAHMTLAAEQGKAEGAPSEGWHNVAADMHDTYWQKATDRGVWAVTPTSRMERLTMAQGQHRRAALVGPDGLVCTVYAMTDRAVMISADAATVRS